MRFNEPISEQKQLADVQILKHKQKVRTREVGAWKVQGGGETAQAVTDNVVAAREGRVVSSQTRGRTTVGFNEKLTKHKYLTNTRIILL